MHSFHGQSALGRRMSSFHRTTFPKEWRFELYDTEVQIDKDSSSRRFPLVMVPFLFIFLGLPLYFLIVGTLTRCEKWQYSGWAYLLFMFVLPFVTRNGFLMVLALASALVCVFHVFASFKEVRARLQARRDEFEADPSDSLPCGGEDVFPADDARFEKVAKHAVLFPQAEGNAKTAVRRSEPPSSTPRGPFPQFTEFAKPAGFAEFAGKIRDMKAAVKDKAVGGYLNEIESLLKNMSEHLEKYPEKREKAAMLEKYYMPETIKLLERYVELSKTQVRTRHVKVAKAEIEKFLATVVEAFRKLYDDLLRDVTSEILTDIKVLTDVFNQNGLIEKPGDLSIGRKENDGFGEYGE